MKNILTIDFDIIMAPSISFYNDLVPKMNWNELKNIPQLNVNLIDAHHYQYLTKFFAHALKVMNKNDIVFIENHSRVLDFIPMHEDIYLTNVDHHHDIAYAQEDVEGRCQKANCSNWVKYIYENRNLKKYTWINNSNSLLIQNSLNHIINYQQNLIDWNNENKNFDIPDKLILCLSEPWTPPNYRPLFFTWMDMYNQQFNTFCEIKYGEYRSE